MSILRKEKARRKIRTRVPYITRIQTSMIHLSLSCLSHSLHHILFMWALTFIVTKTEQKSPKTENLYFISQEYNDTNSNKE